MIQQVLEQSGAALCVDCGKCTAACPMAEMYKDFSLDMSPRGMIQKALKGEDVTTLPGIWNCVGCNSGTDVCPEGVSCRDFVKGIRQIALDRGETGKIISCTRCGVMVTTLGVTRYLGEKLPGAALAYLTLCPDCRRQVYLERNTLD